MESINVELENENSNILNIKKKRHIPIFRITVITLLLAIFLTLVSSVVVAKDTIHKVFDDFNKIIEENEETLIYVGEIVPETEDILEDVDDIKMRSESTSRKTSRIFTISKILCKIQNCIDKDDYNDDYVDAVHG